MSEGNHGIVTTRLAVAVPSTLPNGYPSANISPGRGWWGVWRGYDVAGVGGGEFALRLVSRQRVAPLYWRSRTHTYTHWFLMSSIFCPYWIPWVNVDIVRWCCNWILLNIFRAQTINQIQSAIYAINQNISSNNRQCIKSYSSHKWKQTKFSKTEYLEIFLQLKRTSNHTLLTNENRQTFPKQNILKFFFN